MKKRGTTYVKGKGDITTFWLDREDASIEPANRSRLQLDKNEIEQCLEIQSSKKYIQGLRDEFNI